MHTKFYYHDVSIVTSLVLRRQSVSAVFCPAVITFSIMSKLFTQKCIAGLVKHNSVVSDEKREEVQQADVFKRQTNLAFHFSTFCPNSFKHILCHQTPVRPYERTDIIVGRQNNTTTSLLLINNTFWTMSKPFTQKCIAGVVKHLSPYSGRISD